MPDDRRLRPFAFHDALASTLEQHEPGLWRWFSSDDYGRKYADNVKLELLRSTYRLPLEGHQKLYALAAEVCAALELTVPLTLYQAQSDGALNAGLVFVRDEAHVVLQGAVLQTLGDAELKALLGHELAHHRLWTEAGGRFRVADSLTEYIVSQPGSAPSHQQSALRARRWTELYADRGSLLGCDDLPAAVACLVKMSTGLREVDAEAYLAQADEALRSSEGGSEGRTHPEAFIRAFALRAWSRGEDEQVLKPLVEGPLELETLDLVQQQALTLETRQLLGRVLAPAWMKTEATLAHARRFFPDVNFEAPAPPAPLQPAALPSTSLQEYFAYLLLDFALADPDLEDQALAHVAHLGQRLGLDGALPRLARKELRLSAASYAALERKGAELALEGAAP